MSTKKIQITTPIVTSVNGATGDVVLDIPTNVVQYTEQTLTDEEKKQARENIGVGELDNEYAKVELLCPAFGSFDVFVGRGDIKPYSDDASAAIKTAYQNLYLMFYLQAGFQSDNQFSSFCDGLYEAYSAGLITAPLDAYTSPLYWSRPGIHISASDNSFAVKWYFWNGAYALYNKNPQTGEFTSRVFDAAPIQASTSNLSTTQPAVKQFLMSAAPTADMQVATKHYVDSSIPSLDGYATQQWVEDKGYLMEHQSLADYAKKADIPTVPDSLKNPNALTFTGAATGTYDGSEAVTINIPEGGSSSSVQADWDQNDSNASDYIKNRPFYNDDKPFEDITWDGVTGDKYSVSMDSAAGNTTTDFVLVSDKVVSSNSFIGAKISFSTGEEITCTSSNVSDETNNIMIMNGTDVVLVVEKTDGGDAILTKKGIYFIRTTKSNSTTYTSKLAAPENVVKLDTSYLPAATVSALGAIKVGNGLSIAEDGTLSVTTATYYSGASTPADTLGTDGDLYLQTEG